MRFCYHYPETQGAEGDMLDPGPVHEVAAGACAGARQQWANMAQTTFPA
jgi:hypothetical protein